MIWRLVALLLVLGAPVWATPDNDAAIPPAPPTPESIRDEVFVMLQRGVASTAGEALQQAAIRTLAGDGALASLLRDRQDLNEARSRWQTLLSEAIQQTGANAEAAITEAETELRRLRDEAQSLEAQIEDAFPAFQEFTNPRPMTLPEVQATLAPDEAMIVTLSSEYNVFVWAISPTAADWHVAAFEQNALDGHVRRLRAQLDVTQNARAAAALDDEETETDTPQLEPFDRSLAHQLYRDLLAPVAPVLEGADQLIAVVDGALTSLPLSILVTEEPQGSDADPFALRDTPWLVRRHAMTVLPNVSSLRSLRQEVRSTAPRRPFVGFGDPIFDGVTLTATRGGQPLASVSDLAPLPNTATELRRLARLTGQDPAEAVFLGPRATESAVKAADLSDVQIVAFATHGLLTGELAEVDEPALAFTPEFATGAEDALLTASEAAALKLSADLVILSACNTAASDGTPGAEGLSGLARAFIYAGARSILVSHWPVDDFATVQLTTGMVGDMQSGRARSDALRRAMLNLMETHPRAAYAHPRFWAPFILVGDGSGGA